MGFGPGWVSVWWKSIQRVRRARSWVSWLNSHLMIGSKFLSFYFLSLFSFLLFQKRTSKVTTLDLLAFKIEQTRE